MSPRRPAPADLDVSDEEYARHFTKSSRQNRVTDPRDPAFDDSAMVAMEQAIEDRAAEYMERGFSEDHAWTRAQDELCPQEEF